MYVSTTGSSRVYGGCGTSFDNVNGTNIDLSLSPTASLVARKSVVALTNGHIMELRSAVRMRTRYTLGLGFMDDIRNGRRL